MEQQQQQPPVKRLYRSETDRMLAGVCGGLGEFFGLDATLVRVVFVLLAFASGAGVIAYVVMWLIVPTHSKAGLPAQHLPGEGLSEMREGVERGSRKARESYERWRGRSGEAAPPPDHTGFGAQPPGAREPVPDEPAAPGGETDPAPGGDPEPPRPPRA